MVRLDECKPRRVQCPPFITKGNIMRIFSKHMLLVRSDGIPGLPLPWNIRLCEVYQINPDVPNLRYHLRDVAEVRGRTLCGTLWARTYDVWSLTADTPHTICRPCVAAFKQAQKLNAKGETK